MSKYYKKPEFPEIQADKEKFDKPAFEVIDTSSPIAVDVSGAITQVREEIKRLRSGTSKLRRGGMHGSFPAESILQSFADDPTNRLLLHKFILGARQDFGERVALHFVELFKEADSNLETTLWTS